MARRGVLLVLLLALGLGAGLSLPVRAPSAEPTKPEPLVDKVKKAIADGIGFLRSKQLDDGSWEVDPTGFNRSPGGWTGLAMLALLNAGVKPEDPMMQRGLRWLRNHQMEHTYSVALQTMVFAYVNDPRDAVRIQRNVDWLIHAEVRQDGKLKGWTYTSKLGAFGLASVADNSNTQYALLGLHEGHQAGAVVDSKVWEDIRQFYIDSQYKPDATHPVSESWYGSWAYTQSRGLNSPRFTMTTAGLCGLLIAGAELNKGREKRVNGVVSNCGEYDEDPAVQRALNWVSTNFRVTSDGTLQNQYPYYSIYGVERAGRLSGLRFFGSHDWYREGCAWLTGPGRQAIDGSWTGGGALDSWPVVSTSFALLFLSKGRTPVLVSKMKHGPREDWNNDHNDCRHLVEYMSNKVFKHQPLAWQVFDMQRGLEANGDDSLRVTADLLQSPVAFINGHEPPIFQGGEEKILAKYVDEGGFIIAEACCNKEPFRQGFTEMADRLFGPDSLKKLPADHPIYTAHFLVPPDKWPLYGVEQGCKTVLVLSPKDLSCFWEENDFTSEEGKQAFELGANIIWYATGGELPRPRLTEVDVSDANTSEKKMPRGVLKVAQLRHDGNWAPAPKAMHNLMQSLQQKLHLPVVIPNDIEQSGIRPNNREVLNYKFLYMHGRDAFSFDNDERAITNLRSDLQTGGLLLADACCGRPAFDKSFRHFMEKVFPDRKLERIPLTDELFSKELNGAAITTVRCRREHGQNAQYKDVEPFLEGIKYRDRWVVIYSKYDLGCALEHHPSSDCLGHDYPSALRLATAAVLYALMR